MKELPTAQRSPRLETHAQFRRCVAQEESERGKMNDEFPMNL